MVSRNPSRQPTLILDGAPKTNVVVPEPTIGGKHQVLAAAKVAIHTRCIRASAASAPSPIGEAGYSVMLATIYSTSGGVEGPVSLFRFWIARPSIARHCETDGHLKLPPDKTTR